MTILCFPIRVLRGLARLLFGLADLVYGLDFPDARPSLPDSVDHEYFALLDEEARP